MQVFNILNLKPEIGGYFHFGNLQLAPVSLNVKQPKNSVRVLDELFDEGLVEVSEVHEAVSLTLFGLKIACHLVIFDNDLIKGARQTELRRQLL